MPLTQAKENYRQFGVCKKRIHSYG
ncbi:hypothetical protein [Paenibacillus foliorum]